VLTWCISNVVEKADRCDDLYPTKCRPDQKIDAAVALMMAVGRAMVEDEQAKGQGWMVFLQFQSLDNDSRLQ
jgi:phage terminase large subunit-like protein